MHWATIVANENTASGDQSRGLPHVADTGLIDECRTQDRSQKLGFVSVGGVTYYEDSRTVLLDQPLRKAGEAIDGPAALRLSSPDTQTNQRFITKATPG